MNSKLAMIIGAVFVPVLGSVIVYLISHNLSYALVVLMCCTLLSRGIIRYVLIDPETSRLVTVATIATVGIGAASTTALVGSNALWLFAYAQVRKALPELNLPDLAGVDGLGVALPLAILFATVILTVVVMRRPVRAPGNIRKPSDLDARQLSVISRTLADNLDRLDQELRFFDFRSPTIDPALEELNSTSRRIRTRSLGQILSNAVDGQFIVVKGEPGSGKSVMVRNLVRQALGRIRNHGKVPLLLNLREWEAPNVEAQAALVASLGAWVQEEYWRQTGSRERRAVNEELTQLYSEGGLILLFDSFDENRTVSGARHNSPVIRRLSQCLAEYVRGSGGCVGVVFSREYKSPSAGWMDHVVYGVRPYSDADVRKYLAATTPHQVTVEGAIFGDRLDLYAMAKTPLLLALIVEYSNRHNGFLPDSEFSIFESFVEARVNSAINELRPTRVRADDVYAVARRIARNDPGVRADEPALAVLRRSRLLRPADDGIAFSHRRFQEYFRVLGMLAGEEVRPDLAPGHIDNNRDVLNLYGQICPLVEAQELARQAHDNLQLAFQRYEVHGSMIDYEAVVLSLRFLKNAFRNRPDLVVQYQDPIRAVVITLWNSFEIMQQKHAVENIALLPPPVAANLIRRTLEQPAMWLRRVALWQARYVAALHSWLGRCLVAFYSRESEIDIAFDYKVSGIGAALKKAERHDKVVFALDVLFRFALIVMFFVGVWLEDPLVGRVYGCIVMLLYFVHDIGDGPGRESFQSAADGGFNKGLSGFIALMVVFGVFWNALGASLAGSAWFWHKQGPAVVSWIILSLIAAMAVNNVIARRRDQLDEFGAVNPLPAAVLAIERPSVAAVARFSRRNMVFIVLVCMFSVGTFFKYVASALTVGVIVAISISVLWACWYLLRGAWEKILMRFDYPKIKRFGRHFTGRRAEIAFALAEVRSDSSRFDLLTVADARWGDFAAVLRDQDNVWPDDRPSYSPGVEAYLAVLDERWRGLN